jgi:hypothetical protein
MTLQKLSAGSGYEYLTRQVAALDSTEKGSIPLADYYSAKGEAPGRWIGSGLDGIDALAIGDIVTAEQMKNLFGSGCDPITGRPLGAAYKVYANETVDAFNTRVDELLAHSPTPTPAERATARSTAARELFVAEHGREPAFARELSAALARYSRPRQTAVAGFDLTFSPVKSVSALWAVAPPEIAATIEQAHQAAVADALAFIEQHALFTREGKDGARQVETRGLIAAAFTHRDSRAGDPDLHTHGAMWALLSAAAGNSSASLPDAVCRERWSLTSGTRCGGIATSRLPASDLGGPTMNSPSTRTTPLRIFTRLVRRSMSPRRSSVSSPKRIAHQAASSAISW